MRVTHKFLQSIFILLIFSLRKVFGDSCKTPDDKGGNCIKLSECEVLKNLIPLARQNLYYRYFLKQSQCLISNVPWVCCPVNEETTVNSPEKLVMKIDLPRPNGGVCGRIFSPNGHAPNRIIGGEEANLGEFPWYALLVYNKPFYRTGYHCGGTLITSTHVITAAHCVSKNIIPSTWNVTKVRLGEKDLTTNVDCSEIDSVYHCGFPPLEIDIERIIIHELYNSQRGSPNDIAILKLAQSVEFNDFISPICLPIERMIRTDYGSGIIAGFGETEENSSSDVLLKAEISIVNHNDCMRKYAVKDIKIHSKQICAIGNNADSCKGDSGSGFFMQDENTPTWFLVGITSFGPRNCNTEFPGIYIKVKDFIDWIHNKINE